MLVVTALSSYGEQLSNMGKFSKIHWILFCILVFTVSRGIMIYQYNLANNILIHGNHSFADLMCKWDCKWYLTIINNGYDEHLRTTPKVWAGLANWAFFPLYPYLVRIISVIIQIKASLVGIILNQGFVLLALMIFYKYLKIYVDELNSRFGVLILAFSPFSIYFASLYTEALFLLLSLAAFYFMESKKPFLAAICGGLLSATRPIGCMFVIPFCYNLIKKHGIKTRIVFYAIIAVSGLLCYMLFLYFKTGDCLAFHTVQKGWGRHGFDTRHLGYQLWKMLTDYHNSLIFLVALGLSIYLLFSGYVKEAMFNFLAIIPGVLTGTMMSEGRFSGTLFTFYFGIVILSRKSTTLKLSISVLFFLFYVSYFLYWMAHASFLI